MGITFDSQEVKNMTADTNNKPSKATQRVRLNLTPETADRLRALAKADNRTLSGFITNLLDNLESEE